ncbi:uncharacterized protein LOC135416625 [Pseudopipra pipra]|uniref:uncharacterized protein LOC135416625 n=1 Tax=Pseudopipra pipra TaxID=415032 RepID=UPI00313967EA
MPSLPQDSPAGGLGTGFPLVRVHGGDRSDLLSLYVTTYEVSFGKRPPGLPHAFEGRVLGVKPPDQAAVHPLLGVHSGSGYVTNNYSALSSLITPRPKRPEPFVSMSATSEDFRPFGRPQFQRILPQCVEEPECSYPPEFSLSRIRYEGLKPPKLSRGSSAKSGCTSPAQPDLPQWKPDLSSGCAPTDACCLPAEPGVPALDPCCPQNRHGLPAMGHHPPFAPLELRVGPQEPSKKDPQGYSTIHNQHLTNLSPLAPVAPAWWSQGPTWAPRSVEGVQVPRPSGFSTNNLPTNLWHNDDPFM